MFFNLIANRKRIEVGIAIVCAIKNECRDLKALQGSEKAMPPPSGTETAAIHQIGRLKWHCHKFFYEF
jgi:hypothetical protein